MGKPAARKTTATSRSYRGRGHLGARDVGFFWLHAQIDVRRSLADRAGQASSGARQANPEACRGAGGVGLCSATIRMVASDNQDGYLRRRLEVCLGRLAAAGKGASARF
jgi:hypothetical protein